MSTKEIITKVLTELGPSRVEDIRNHSLCQSKVYPKEKISSSAISRHLNAMLSDGLVKYEWDGTRNFYKVWRLK